MSPQAGWILQEEVVPRLRASIPRNVSFIGSEDAEELVQDATVLAASLLDRTERQGKTVTPGNIAYYTILHMKSGRRSYGTNTSDALGTGTQLNGRSILNSLEEVVSTSEAGDEIFEIHDVLSTDQEDPSQIAARRIDWAAFIAGLSKREKTVIEFILLGRNMSEVALKLKVCLGTVLTARNGLVDKIIEYMGADILKEIRRLPGWRDGLNASRERLACRQERRH